MDRETFDRLMRERYTENPDHLTRQAHALRTIAGALGTGTDDHGNGARVFASAADRAETRREALLEGRR